MERKAAGAEAGAAEKGLLASGGNGPSQQVNTPTITTTATDVCGSTSDPVKGGEKELGIQNDEEFNLEDAEALKIKGTPPATNWSACSKDSFQDQTNQNDTYISNYDETSGHVRDESKEPDLEMENKRVPALRKQTISQRRSKGKRRRSHEHEGIFGGKSCCDYCSSWVDSGCYFFRICASAMVTWCGGGGEGGRARRHSHGGAGAGAGGGGCGGGCGGGGGAWGGASFQEPNPGISRPRVTISRPPPPPPPPTL